MAAAYAAAQAAAQAAAMPTGGRFDFDDGGTYCGQWEEGKAHGHGVCTGPKGQGEYSGAWHYGYEVSGVYTWPSGNYFEGQWQNGKRHGLGVEYKGRWIYRGEWTQGFPGRYGVRFAKNSPAKYEGTWANGLQDGYGTETYADSGTFQGQWLRGMRHGYGIRRSVAYGVAAKYKTSKMNAHASLTSLRSEQGDDSAQGPNPLQQNASTSDATAASHGRDKKPGGGHNAPAEEARGGFVLRARSEPPVRRRSLSERSINVRRKLFKGFGLTKQRSTGDIHTRLTTTGEPPRSIRSSGSTASCTSEESNLTGYSHEHFAPEEPVDPATTETYMGEWKNDRRSGFGISERSDGLKYEGEWFNNKKFGYGVTTHRDGTKEEGKYKNNVLVTSGRRKNMIFVRSSKLRERIDNAVNSAGRAAQIAMQKADIAITRSATARDRAEQADQGALVAKDDSNVARLHAKQFAPDFDQPGLNPVQKEPAQTNHVPHHLSSNASPSRSDGGNSSVFDKGGGGGVSNALPQKSLPIPNNRDPSSNLTYLGGDLQNGLETPSGQQEFKTIHTTSIEGPYLHGGDPQANYDPSHEHGARRNLVSGGNDQYLESPNSLQRPQPNSALSYGALTQNYARNTNHSAMGGLEDSYLQQRIPDARLLQHPRVGFLSTGDGRDSPGISRTPSQSSSRYSINQQLNDHFDQYAVHTAQSRAAQQQQMRQLQYYPNEMNPAEAQALALQRRSTLSSTKDPRAQAMLSLIQQEQLSGLAVGPGAPSLAQQQQSQQPQMVYNSRASGLSQMPVGASTGLVRRVRPFEPQGSLERSDSKQSLPDSSALLQSPVQMSREEVARLSSARREEVRRIHEEEDALRANPFRYLFHPAVREWIARRKLLLLVIAVNLSLSVMFYRLLSHQQNPEDDEPPDLGQ